VDAWSVTGGTTLGARFAGIETKLFQAGLPPYLVYLWFLGAPETRAPEASNFGARFLLAFVLATIPAGVVAKTTYGDVLANVDVLHGASESLLTCSNFLFAFGFATAIAAETASATATATAAAAAAAAAPDSTSGDTASPAAALLALVAVAGAGAAAVAGAVAAAGGPASALGLELVEPANALSLPTWVVHTSSVAEWCLAMRLIYAYADVSGNREWRSLSYAMTPFLASAFSACAFHLFYNAPAINALVPLQALATFGGNVGCAVAAYRISNFNGAVDSASARASDDGDSTANRRQKPSWAPTPNVFFPVKLGVSSVLAACVVKYGSLAAPAHAFLSTPTYPKALACIFIPTLAWSAVVFGGDAIASGGNEKKDSDSFWSELSMEKVKTYGKSGTIAYVVVELAFWAIAFPAAVAWYRVADGQWLDLSDPADKAKLVGAGAVFINGVRALVPLRLASAIALAPYVEEVLGGGGGEDEDEEEEEDASSNT
jgi:hypothetical protein